MLFTLLSLVALLAELPASARIGLYTAAGGGASNTSVRNSIASNELIRYHFDDYKSVTGGVIINPNLSVFISVPITGRVSFEGGVMYVQKGFYGFISELWGSWEKEYASKGTFHYLNVPMVLSYRLLQRKKASTYIGGGVNYGLFLAGRATTKTTESLPGQIIYQYEETHPVIGVFTNASFLEDPQGKYIELLDVMFRLQLRHEWDEKYTMGIFYDNSFTGVYARIYKHTYSNLRQPYLGIFLGYRWH